MKYTAAPARTLLCRCHGARRWRRSSRYGKMLQPMRKRAVFWYRCFAVRRHARKAVFCQQRSFVLLRAAAVLAKWRVVCVLARWRALLCQQPLPGFWLCWQAKVF
ncbi:hypothetical protein NPIL_232681 [Nephila pilipes]|uniref:Uncharacterized protein n=1 Tax=Nephila pilipes TaxID=299642 RepID=A0A8X6QQR0_NEPPI|nr:hypothetical protein NPIL_232681 [Nephila pilipes]